MYDIIVVGGGPAGLTAALYGRRAGKSVLVLEKNTFGGQITWSPKVENFPTISSVSGLDFADRLTAQVMDSGANLELDEVTAVEKTPAGFRVMTAFGAAYDGKTVIASVGAKPKQLGLENEDQYIGAGLSYCAVCDGEFFKDRVVAVNGGGNSALQEALYLSDLCKTVYLIHRRDTFRGDLALVEAVSKRENIQCLYSWTIAQLIGEESLKQLVLSNLQGETKTLDIDGLFVAIGHVPENEIFSSFMKLDESGYAASAENCLTELPGLFVAGDCRKKEVRQLTTAMSDGATSALAACQYIDRS